MEAGTYRRDFLKKVGGSLAGAISLFSNGCDRDHNEYSRFESHPVDQVFRDHDGFRLLYTDENNFLIERKYSGTLSNPHDYPAGKVALEGLPGDIVERFTFLPILSPDDSRVRLNDIFMIAIIKDLDNGERGFASNLTYNIVREVDSDIEATYTEIHLPKDREISPGNERFGGKFPVEAPIGKVK